VSARVPSLAALGGMIAAPVRTARAIATDGASPLPPLGLLLVVTALIQLKVLGRLAFLVDDGGAIALRRMREAMVDPLKTDAVLLAATGLVLAALAQLFARGRVSPMNAAIAGAWLVIPLVCLKAIGGALQGLGLDLWWLPHHAVDSLSALVVERRVSWVRFAIKCVTAYGAPLAIGLALVASLRREGREGREGRELPKLPVLPELPVLPVLPVGPGRLRLGLAISGLCLLALVGSAASVAVRQADRIRPTIPGDALPDAELRILKQTGVSKERLKLSSLQGSVVLLDFWASWCAPCRRAMPELSVLADELGPAGLVVVGINREPGEPAAAKKALAALAPRFASVIDERGYGERLGLTTLPTSYIVDRQGVVRHLHLGYTDPAILRAEIEALLAPPGRTAPD
jgi:thiol-disulfide isomerase/thioredoxin